jgi:transposase-like protein
MGQVLHKRAKTTEAVRREIQNSKESLKKLAKKYSITPNTVAKWRKRDYVHDSKM